MIDSCYEVCLDWLFKRGRLLFWVGWAVVILPWRAHTLWILFNLIKTAQLYCFVHNFVYRTTQVFYDMLVLIPIIQCFCMYSFYKKFTFFWVFVSKFYSRTNGLKFHRYLGNDCELPFIFLSKLCHCLVMCSALFWHITCLIPSLLLYMLHWIIWN